MPGTRIEMEVYVNVYFTEPNKFPSSFNKNILVLTAFGTHHLVNRDSPLCSTYFLLLSESKYYLVIFPSALIISNLQVDARDCLWKNVLIDWPRKKARLLCLCMIIPTEVSLREFKSMLNAWYRRVTRHGEPHEVLDGIKMIGGC